MRLFFRRKFLPASVFAACLIGCAWNPEYRVRSVIVHVQSTDEILVIDKPVVVPIVYTHIRGLEKLPVDIAKAKFISAVLPSILIARFEVDQDRKRMTRLRGTIQWSSADSLFYEKIKSHYKAHDVSDLLVRMKPLPVSIVLAQAAIETGWGKSRIFVSANNVFGVWSFNKREPRIAALVKRGNKRVYLRSYPDITHSVMHYFQVIGGATSFGKLREVLAATNDPSSIVPYLRNYSERRTAYTRQVQSVIDRNNLTLYDRFIINPSYIVAHE